MGMSADKQPVAGRIFFEQFAYARIVTTRIAANMGHENGDAFALKTQIERQFRPDFSAINIAINAA